ncbi:MAG: hypothetical protein GY817_02065 [bacterium]|nr:hypothetical protein [bacterium]
MLKFRDWNQEYTEKSTDKILDSEEVPKRLSHDECRNLKIDCIKNESVQIFIKNLQDKTMVLDCNLNDKVNSIKYRIQDMTGLNTEDFYITYSNKILDFNKQLLHYGILSKDCLNISCRIRGGTKPGLSILIECKKCRHQLWKNINEKNYTLGEDLHRCFKCNRIAEVKALGFVNCAYTLKGLGKTNGKAYIHNEVKNKPEKLDLNIDKWIGLSVVIHSITNDLEKFKKFIDSNKNENDKNIGNTYNIFVKDSFNDNSDNSNNSINDSFNDNRKYNYKTERKDNSWKFSLSLWPF